MEKEVIKDVVQEIRVPQVKALYPFAGQGLKMAKGEVGKMIKDINQNLHIEGVGITVYILRERWDE